VANGMLKFVQNVNIVLSQFFDMVMYERAGGDPFILEISIQYLTTFKEGFSS